MNSHFIRRKIPFIYSIYLCLTQKRQDKKLIGETKSFGLENPDKTFFIIRINNPNLGLMAIHDCVLGYVRLADKNGYIPDLKNYLNGYLEIEEVGKINAWEYFFEQTSKYSLDEVYRSKNVILSSGVSPREAASTSLNFMLNNKKKAKYYFNLIDKHLHIKNDIQKNIDSESRNILGNKRVIGVSSRGSDMLNLTGHTIQPDTKDLISKTKRMLIKWNCEYVFLASEEEHVVKLFKNNFGDKLLLNESHRVDSSIYIDNYVPLVNLSFERSNDKYLSGLEYLTTVVILSRCNCLIGSLVGKTVGAIEMNNNSYENKFIYDLGVYK
jgi:hypothetical protein